MTDTIDDRLNKVLKDLDGMLGKSDMPRNIESDMDFLIHFGFTFNEAKAWLKREPNYVRRKVTEDKSDTEVTEPFFIILI